MAIKLLTFDLDDTLWPCMTTIMRTEEKLYQWFADYHPTIINSYSIEQLRQKRQQLANDYPHIAHDLTVIRKKSFIQLSKEMNYSSKQEALFINHAFNLYINERNKVDLFDDVIPALNTLKLNYRLAAVTNGNADIYHIGLGHLFDFSWSAADAGQQKPHPIIFNSLLQKQQLQAHEVIHIGDDPITDIQGAHNANIQAIWLNRHHQPWPSSLPPPELEINQLHQLPHLLKNRE
jgi:putative hydrolase of the HAD superfamily